MEAGAGATAEYHDELNFEFVPIDTPLHMEGVLFFEGFSSVTAIASGIDGNNVVAEIAVVLSGTNSLGNQLLASKKANGSPQVPQTIDDPFNLLDSVPIIDFSYDVVSGVPFPVFIKLTILGRARLRRLMQRLFCPWSWYCNSHVRGPLREHP